MSVTFATAKAVIPLMRTAARRPGMVCAALAALISTVAASGQEPKPADAPQGNPTQVTVTDRGTVEMHVANLPISTVLQLLSLEGQRNIIASPNVKGTVTANLYGATFEEALEAVLAMNDAGYRRVGNFINVYTNAELALLSAASTKQPMTRVFWLDNVSADDAEAGLKVILGDNKLTIWAKSSSKSNEKGGTDKTAELAVSTNKNTGSGGITGGNRLRGYARQKREFIVVKADSETLRVVEGYLREIDVGLDYLLPKQVLVEATILRAELKDDNALGIDFSIVGGVDLEQLGAVSNGIRNVTVGNLPKDRFERFNAASSTDFTGNVPSGGITVGVIKDKVAVFLRALEQVTDTTVIANPKLLALDEQEAQVLIGRRDGYLTTTITETQAVQTVEFLETGTQLIFRPTVCKDGYVQIQLNPKDSIGFVNAQGLPTEQTTEAKTSVLVRDGQTILIGGLFREVTTDAKSQVPGLGSIPWVGQLFRSNNDSNGREEVIILLTVHIVKDQDAYAAASRDQIEQVERMRVGMRQGLMWHGRDRLAQTHYQKALTALDANDRDKALWHVKMALNAAPRHLPAIELKEKILGERAWYDDATSTRNFLYRLIAQEKGYPLQPFGRPAADAVPGASP